MAILYDFVNWIVRKPTDSLKQRLDKISQGFPKQNPLVFAIFSKF